MFPNSSDYVALACILIPLGVLLVCLSILWTILNKVLRRPKRPGIPNDEYNTSLFLDLADTDVMFESDQYIYSEETKDRESLVEETTV